MAERKIFAGARLKRLRQRLGLSQTQMAAELGLSPSYLNLIERNQRPLTVQVLLKLSGVYSLDMTELSGGEDTGTIERLREIFSDPLLAGEIASPAELSEFYEAAPNAARAVVRVHAAWREALERLSDLSHSMARGTELPPESPAPASLSKAAAYFEQASPWFPALEEAAEGIAQRLKPRDDPAQALRLFLREGFGVDTRILPLHVMPVEQARYDRHSLRLFISERVPLLERPFLLARQAALLALGPLLDQLTRHAGLAEAEAARVCRAGFARRAAEAILAPAGRLGEALREVGPDIRRLSDHFVLRPSRVVARIAALGAGVPGIPAAFALHLDASGGVLSRMPGGGFPFPRFGPFCARLPLFDALQPGRSEWAELVLPDGAPFLAVALAEEGTPAAGLPPPRRLTMIGWRREEFRAAFGGAPAEPRPIGVTCRLCERFDCAHRLHAPLARPAGFLEHAVGPSDYELLG